nr:magnesium transporter NIPA [Tanacetum cinerariifolium]
MHIFGVVGCVLCLFGSTTIVLHAPHETPVSSVRQVWHFATEPGFLVYACIVLVIVGVLIYRYVPRYGQTHLIVYVGICSLMGSLTVCLQFSFSLSFSRHALDTFNTNVISPVYYVMFTSVTIVASMIMFKESVGFCPIDASVRGRQGLPSG